MDGCRLFLVAGHTVKAESGFGSSGSAGRCSPGEQGLFHKSAALLWYQNSASSLGRLGQQSSLPVPRVVYVCM